ncbi:MAG: hypothetical protein NVSMB1_00580 [Polyangiales bacterium]
MALQPLRRGALAIGAAKGWFLVVGLALNVLLPHAIGQAGYGSFKRAQAFVNLVNNVIVVASIQAVSRAVAAADDASRRGIIYRATALHASTGAFLCLAFYLCVPSIVRNQHAPQLEAPLRTMAFVLFAYSVYAPLIGGLNGARAFGKQAALDAGYSTLRTALTVGVGWYFVHHAIGAGALGSSVGFLSAALVIVPFASLALPKTYGGVQRLQVAEHLSFFGALIVMQAFQSFVLQIDLVILGRAATLRNLEHGLPDPLARQAADRLAGLYAQAQAFGLVPYQLLLAASYVLFPTIAASRARNDHDAIRADVAKGGRATLVIALGLATALGGAPIALLRLAYGHGGDGSLPIEHAALILRALALAHAATAIATVGTSLVAASGRGRAAAVLGAAIAVFGGAGASLGAHMTVGADETLGLGIAIGLCIGIVLATVIVALSIRLLIGEFLPRGALARVVIATTVAMIIGGRLPVPSARILCFLPWVAPPLIYLAILSMLREPLWQLVGISSIRGRLSHLRSKREEP